jgi:hypothetical protein
MSRIKIHEYIMYQGASTNNSTDKFDILQHLSALTPDGGSHGKNECSYHCPLCQATNFKVTIDGPDKGKYSGYGCDCMTTPTGKQAVINAISPAWEKPIRPEQNRVYGYDILENGSLQTVVKLSRNDDGKGGRKWGQSHWNGKKWAKGLTDEVKKQLHLYRIFDPINQDALGAGEPLFIVEGEGKVEALHSLGIAATCAIGGGGKWKAYGYPNYLEDLEGANLIICPDRDKPGIKHAEQIAEDFPDAPWLYAAPTSYMWTRDLPASKGYDVADWIEDRATKEDILGAIEPKRVLTIAQLPTEAGEAPKEEKRAPADQIIDIARKANISYFMTPDEVVYADVQEGETRRTLAIREKAFRLYLRNQYFDKNGKSPGGDAVQQAIDTLEALASRDADKRETHIRLASHEGRIYIDLGDESWKAIEVSVDGWRLVNDAPVRFIRGACAPLPVPTHDGRVEDLKDLCQFDETQWVLILAFLLQGVKPEKGYPILLLHGGPHAGKSTITRALKGIVDPSIGKPRKNVGAIRDFAIHATKRHVIGIDNLSGLSADQSDILCTASTGGGHSERALHSDSGEIIFDFTNLLILNGIDTIATRGDLLSRSFPITVHPPEKRLSEAEFDARFQVIHPGVLGALLTLLSRILPILPEVKGLYTGNKERFIAFVELGLALERVMEWEEGTFLRVIGDIRDDAHETAIESSPVGQAIQSLMTGKTEWDGTMGELLVNLRHQVPDRTWQSKMFPQDATRLSQRMTRLQPDLRALGITYHTQKGKSGKQVFLQNIKTASPASPASPSLVHKDLEGDARKNVASPASPQRHLFLSPEMEGDAKSSNGDATKKLASPLEPLWERGRDAGDAGDAKNAQFAPWENLEKGKWFFSVSINTQVQLLQIRGHEVRVKVPGMGDRWLEMTDLVCNEDGVTE